MAVDAPMAPLPGFVAPGCRRVCPQRERGAVAPAAALRAFAIGERGALDLEPCRSAPRRRLGLGAGLQDEAGGHEQHVAPLTVLDGKSRV